MAIQRRRITKRAPPRGVNKRRRAVDDEAGREDSEEEENEDESEGEQFGASSNGTSQSDDLPRTPKRARMSPLVPEILPLGLERSDFWKLQNPIVPHVEDAHQQHQFSSQSYFPTNSVFSSFGSNMDTSETTDTNMEVDPIRDTEWTSEEDRVLVDMVLEKMKLTKSEWADCARSLGRDRGSLGRRWRSLVNGGEVGLKRRGALAARKGIHATWR